MDRFFLGRKHLLTLTDFPAKFRSLRIILFLMIEAKIEFYHVCIYVYTWIDCLEIDWEQSVFLYSKNGDPER